jgi:hypothetical protein
MCVCVCVCVGGSCVFLSFQAFLVFVFFICHTTLIHHHLSNTPQHVGCPGTLINSSVLVTALTSAAHIGPAADGAVGRSYLSLRPALVASETAELLHTATFTTSSARLATRATGCFGDDAFRYSAGALSVHRTESELNGTVVVSLTQNRMRSGGDIVSALSALAVQHPALLAHMQRYIWTLAGDYYTYTYFSGVVRAAQASLATNSFSAALTRDMAVALCNGVPVLGQLHCTLNAVEDDFELHEQLVRRFWSHIHGAKRLAVKPKLERLNGLLVLLFASWLLVRADFIRCVKDCTDAQVLYVLEVLEFHVPLSIMM